VAFPRPLEVILLAALAHEKRNNKPIRRKMTPVTLRHWWLKWLFFMGRFYQGMGLRD
jgi:hypothetical protein